MHAILDHSFVTQFCQRACVTLSLYSSLNQFQIQESSQSGQTTSVPRTDKINTSWQLYNTFFFLAGFCLVIYSLICPVDACTYYQSSFVCLKNYQKRKITTKRHTMCSSCSWLQLTKSVCRPLWSRRHAALVSRMQLLV